MTKQTMIVIRKYLPSNFVNKYQTGMMTAVGLLGLVLLRERYR